MMRQAMPVLLAGFTLILSTDIFGQEPIAFWEFDSGSIDGRTVADQAGNNPGTILGVVNLYEDEQTSALQLDGESNNVSIFAAVGEHGLPARELTLEAWVSIYSPERWGGIIGAVQDNGSSEQGWVLGYDNSHFTFALSSTGANDGNGKLTYLTAQHTYELRKWYHVVGTYDGAAMRIYVNGALVGTSLEQSGDILYPEHFWLDLGAYHDDNEYFRLHGLLKEAGIYDQTLSRAQVQARFQLNDGLATGAIPTPTPTPTPLPFLAVGPYLQFTAQDTATVSWRTHNPEPSILEYGEREIAENRIEDAALKTEHSLVLHDLKHEAVYNYRLKTRIGETEFTSRTYECDTFFNYSLPPIPETPSPYPQNSMADAYVRAAEQILRETGIAQGYCLVVGSAEGQLAHELARRGNLRVIGVDTDAQAVADARRHLQQTGLYGPRLTIRQVDSYADLPVTDHFANLIVSDRTMAEGTGTGDATEMFRVLRPGGGAVYLGQPEGIGQSLQRTNMEVWLDAGDLDYELSDDANGLWCKVERPALPGAGEWSHQYANPSNAANGQDALLGATGTGEMKVQWIGRPGPRAMADRNPRCPAPLSTNGLLFTQGYHRIIAQDAFNGAINWSLEIPDMERFNMPRDSSNWCADQGFVYAAIEDRCWRIDAQTGNVTAFHPVVSPAGQNAEFDWGYVARSGSLLYGSSVRTGSVFTNIFGGSSEGWYDSRSGDVTYKVCSDNLFAVDPETGIPVWTRTDGVIINTTITIADGRVYFVECRNSSVKADTARRIGRSELWDDQYLVALNAETGAVVYEQPIDTQNGTIVFYLLHANDTLMLAASNSRYYLYGYDAASGDLKWDVSHSWISDNHGQHMQHPVAVGDTVYLRPNGYRISNGTRVGGSMPPREGGCATFAGTAGALVYRGKEGAVSMWDVETRQVTNWYSLRPGCWLSTIPASGMVLSPEGGGGCSCGGWLETSVAFSRR